MKSSSREDREKFIASLSCQNQGNSVACIEIGITTIQFFWNNFQRISSIFSREK